jgi:uncharacterized membrane protein YdjX (TVP38/TMEM64 family)
VQPASIGQDRLTYASIAFASVLAFLAARYLLRDKIQPLLNRRPKNGPSFFDWVLFGLGVLATIALAILVIRETKTKLAEENPT